ncbi:RNA polymerase sigma factor [Bacteroides graminisolvens]
MSMTYLLYEDEQLLHLLLHDDKDAFTAIYKKYHKMLYLLAYKYLQDADLSEDVVQHVYMHLWEQRAAIRVNSSLKNYLYTMAKNHILNLIREKNDLVARQYEVLQFQAHADESLSHKLDRERKLNSVYEALNRLPDNKREICLLKINEGLDNKEIAKRLNLPIGTVKNYYTQSIKLLKFLLKQKIL